MPNKPIMNEEPTAAAVFCRLCTNKTGDDPVRLSKHPPCAEADIVQQHFGVDLFSAGTDVVAYLCHPCWSTTEQFHQLYTAVQQNEAVLLRAVVVRNVAPTVVKAASSPHQSPIKTEDQKQAVPSSLLECKVEIHEEDNSAFDLYPESNSSSPSSPSSRSSSSASSSSSSSSCESYADSTPKRSKAAKRKKPPIKREPSTANRQPKTPISPSAAKRIVLKRTPDEIAEQNIRIREYFQMNCDLCDTRFEMLRDAISHYRREHSLPGYLKCCGKKFFNRTLVLDHIQHHGDPNAFHCERCDRSYISQAALKLHLVSHDEQLPKPYKCVVCAAEFVKYFQLTQHQRQKHLVSTAKSFGCDICGKFFFTKWQMSTHIHCVHIAAHICDICATTFKSKTQLVSHYRRVHIGEIKPKVQCSICAAWLADERSLRKHTERHAQVAAVCTLCGKVTPNQYALGSHMRYVHANRLFPCTMCDKSFKRAIGLREHLAAHTGVDLYTCSYCPRTFKSNSNMFAHRKKAHPIEWGRDRELRNHS